VVTKHHHTLKVSLHYLVKYKSVKSVNIFGEDMNMSLRLTF